MAIFAQCVSPRASREIGEAGLGRNYERGVGYDTIKYPSFCRSEKIPLENFDIGTSIQLRVEPGEGNRPGIEIGGHNALAFRSLDKGQQSASRAQVQAGLAWAGIASLDRYRALSLGPMTWSGSSSPCPLHILSKARRSPSVATIPTVAMTRSAFASSNSPAIQRSSSRGLSVFRAALTSQGNPAMNNRSSTVKGASPSKRLRTVSEGRSPQGVHRFNPEGIKDRLLAKPGGREWFVQQGYLIILKREWAPFDYCSSCQPPECELEFGGSARGKTGALPELPGFHDMILSANASPMRT